MVLGVEGFCYEAGVFSLAVVCLAKNDGESIEPRTIPAENTRYRAGVDATRQEYAHRNIAHHMHLYGLSQCRMEFVFNVAAFGVIRGNVGITRCPLACSKGAMYLVCILP